jgi:hypothetical protein
MLRLLSQPHNGGARDGEFEMLSLAVSERVAGVERLALCRVACPQSLAAAGAACGDRACSRSPHGHHVASHRGRERRLAALGRKSESVATRLVVLILKILPLPGRLLAVIDDSPTKRYGPKVEGADIHRNPTPGPADQKYLYGHIWVTLSLAVRHPLWGALALPLRAMLYVRQQSMAKIPQHRNWRFRTKLELAAKLVEWIAPIVGKAGKTLWIVVDGFYTKWPFLKRSLAAGVVVVGRLRKDAALRDLPPRPRSKRRGRPRKYGKNKISLAKRAGQKGGWLAVECTLYGKRATKIAKTFLATYRPVRGVIRVVLVKEEHGWFALFCTDLAASLRRSGNHRTGLSRRERSLGRRPAASAQHLDQRGRVSTLFVDVYAGRTVGLEPQSRRSL